MDLNNCEREQRLCKMRCALSLLKENVAEIEKNLSVINTKIVNKKVEVDITNPQKLIKETNEKIKSLDDYKNILEKTKEKQYRERKLMRNLIRDHEEDKLDKEKHLKKLSPKGYRRESSHLNLPSIKVHHGVEKEQAKLSKELKKESIGVHKDDDSEDEHVGRQAGGGMIENWDSLERLNECNRNSGPFGSHASIPKIDENKYKTVLKYINSINCSFDALSLDRISCDNHDCGRDYESVKSMDLSVLTQKSDQTDYVYMSRTCQDKDAPAVVAEKPENNTIKSPTKPGHQKSPNKKTKVNSKSNKKLPESLNPAIGGRKANERNRGSSPNKSPLKKPTQLQKAKQMISKTLDSLKEDKNGKSQGPPKSSPQKDSKSPKESKKPKNGLLKPKSCFTNVQPSKKKKNKSKNNTTTSYNRRNTSMNSNIKTFNAFTNTEFNRNFNNFSARANRNPNVISPNENKLGKSKDPLFYTCTYISNQSVGSSNSSIQIKEVSDIKTESMISHEDFQTACHSSRSLNLWPNSPRLQQTKSISFELLSPRSNNEEKPPNWDAESSACGSSLELNSSLKIQPKSKEEEVKSEVGREASLTADQRNLIEQTSMVLQACRTARRSEVNIKDPKTQSPHTPKTSRSRVALESLKEDLNETRTIVPEMEDGVRKASGREISFDDELDDLKFFDSGQSVISSLSSSCKWLDDEFKLPDDTVVDENQEKIKKILEAIKKSSHFEDLERSWERESLLSLSEKSFSSSSSSLNVNINETKSGGDHVQPKQTPAKNFDTIFPIAPEDEEASLRRQMEAFRRSFSCNPGETAAVPPVVDSVVTSEKPVIIQQTSVEITKEPKEEPPIFNKELTSEFFEWLGFDQNMKMSFAEYKSLKENGAPPSYQKQQTQAAPNAKPPQHSPPPPQLKPEDSYMSPQALQSTIGARPLNTPTFSFTTNEKAKENLRLMLSDEKEQLELARLKALKLQTDDPNQRELLVKSLESPAKRIHDSSVSLADPPPPPRHPQETQNPYENGKEKPVELTEEEGKGPKLAPESPNPINLGFFPPQRLTKFEQMHFFDANRIPYYSSNAYSTQKRRDSLDSAKKQRQEPGRESSSPLTVEEFSSNYSNSEQLNNSKFLQFQQKFSGHKGGEAKSGYRTSPAKDKASPISVYKEKTCTVSRTSMGVQTSRPCFTYFEIDSTTTTAAAAVKARRTALGQPSASGVNIINANSKFSVANTIENTTKVICEHLSVTKKELIRRAPRKMAYLTPAPPSTPSPKHLKGTTSNGNGLTKSKVQSGQAELITSSYYKKKYNIYEQLVVPQNSRASNINVTPQTSAGSMNKNKLPSKDGSLQLTKAKDPSKKSSKTTTNNTNTNTSINTNTNNYKTSTSNVICEAPLLVQDYLTDSNEKSRSSWTPPSFGVKSITLRPLHSNSNLICVDKASTIPKPRTLLKPNPSKAPSKSSVRLAPEASVPATYTKMYSKNLCDRNNNNINSINKITNNRSKINRYISNAAPPTHYSHSNKSPYNNSKSTSKPYPGNSPAFYTNVSKIPSNNNNSNARNRQENIRVFSNFLLETKFTDRPAILPKVISCHASTNAAAPALQPPSKKATTFNPIN